TATPNNICAGTEVQLKATVEPDQKLMWKPDPLLSCTDCPDPKVSPTVTTTFEVTTPEATCPGGGSITVVVVPPPPLNLAPNPVICLGDSVLLNNVPVQPGATYVWQASNGLAPVGANPYVAPTVPTTYTVTATGQCVGVGTVTVTPVTASVSASEDKFLCYGDAATLTATVTSSVGGLVTWQPGGFAGNNYTVKPDTTTRYIATLNYGPGCTDTADVLVTVNPAKLELKLPPIPTTICRGDSIKINLAPAEPNVTYTWAASSGAAPTGANPVVSPSGITTYTITATSGQCTKTAATTIQVAEASVSLGPDQTICFGQTLPLTAAVTGTTGGTFQWTPGGFAGNPFNVTPLQTGPYSVVYTYGPGCTATDAVTVTVNPTVTFSPISGDPSPSKPICEGTPVKLRVDVSPAGTPLSWTQNGSPIPGITADSVTVKPLGDKVPTTYTVTASTAAGCSSSASITYTPNRCFEVPNAFTPNGDQVNGTFGIVQYGGDLTVEYMAIYNRWGQKVFETTRPD
ncbi:MAG TPA: gliding motility-associated C-terminal domain-containing protein, partial [Saprospiraceae bacterium]|nr:gliding motility-associated C-terminal domain-containing protein [Saprospiraceae bacterium]